MVIVLELKLSFEVLQNLNSSEVKLYDYFRDKKWNTGPSTLVDPDILQQHSFYLKMPPSCPIPPPLLVICARWPRIGRPRAPSSLSLSQSGYNLVVTEV